jgi:hypothetical protein
MKEPVMPSLVCCVDYFEAVGVAELCCDLSLVLASEKTGCFPLGGNVMAGDGEVAGNEAHLGTYI